MYKIDSIKKGLNTYLKIFYLKFYYNKKWFNIIHSNLNKSQKKFYSIDALKEKKLKG